MLYRKIYTDVEAIQWTGRNPGELLIFVHGNEMNKNMSYTLEDSGLPLEDGGIILKFIGSSGPRIIKPGDYMVKTPTGCCYPLMKEHFEKAYVLVV